MNTVTIGRFRHRTVLPSALAQAGDPGEQVRRAVDLLTGVLPDVLAELRLPPSTLICVRSLSVRLRVGQHALDDTALLARAWAEAITDAVEKAYTAGISVYDPDTGVGEVVVYRNRAAGLCDLVWRVALGDQRRRWAWEQSGLAAPGGGANPAALVVGACLRAPDIAVPVLAWAARQGLLDPLALPWAGWHALARALVPATPAGPGLAPTGQSPARPAAVPELAGLAHRSLPAQARAALATAPLASQMRRTWQRLGDPPAGSQPAIAALALHAGGVAVQVTDLPVAARFLFTARPPILPDDDARSAQSAPSSADPVSTDTPADAPPVTALGARLVDAAKKREITLRRDDCSAAVDRVQATDEAAAAPLGATDDAGATAWTTRAGLLFALNLAALRPIAAEAGAHRRGPAWCLLELGCRLAECDASDAAVRVFAGLAATVLTGAPLEHHLTESAGVLIDPADDQLVSGWVTRCDNELAARLPEAFADFARNPGDLRRSVMCRRARLCLDPGWIEVELPLDGVDVAVRRAGLDLDPGAVAHLGCVVRFRYV